MPVNKVIYGIDGEEIVDQSGNVTVYSVDGTSNRVNKVVFGASVIVDITDTTATEDQVLSGYVIHKADGSKVTGTASQTILNSDGESIDDDTLIVNDGSGGGGSVTVTDEANATGITCVITTSGEPTPSETWEEIYNSTENPNADTPYNYLWLSSLSNIYPTVGSKWRLTINSVEYICTAVSFNGIIGVGNPKYSGGTDDGSACPVCFHNQGWGAWVGDTELPANTPASIKIEQAV